jgi:hypothetical protein
LDRDELARRLREIMTIRGPSEIEP